MSEVRRARMKATFAAALTVILGLLCVATPASAQGSLIVDITAPTSGSNVGGTIPVNATVTLIGLITVRGVQFKLDGANLGAEDTSDPYSISWDTRTASNGSHTLTAVGRDALGILWTSNPVTVTVFNDLTPPTAALTAPSSGAMVRATVSVQANASDNVGVVGVQFRLDGANLGAEDTGPPYSVSWNTTTASDGSHTLTAVARDAAGNTTTSAGVTVTVDNGVPAVAVTAPVNGAHVTGTTVVSANATDNIGVAGVQFRLDGANLGGEDTVPPYSVSWNTTTATDGSHTLTAVARDAAGNTATSSALTVTVDNTGPAVTVTAPSGGALVSATTLVAANASDADGVAGVQFRLDGAALGAEDTSAPYSVAWDTTTAAAGGHTLTAVARDVLGNTSTSAPVAVTVSQTATRFENTELSITYVDGDPSGSQPTGWWHGSRSRGWSGVISSVNRSSGARATFHFHGTTVRWIGFRAPWAGIARVYIDDAFVQDLDLYQTTEEAQAVVFSRTGLTDADHTLTVEATGTKNAAASDYTVFVDAFDVAPPSPPPATGTRVEETAMTLSGGWSAAEALTHAWSTGTAVASATPGAQASFSFLGTEFRWIGVRGPGNGIARVYLDGSFQTEVDTYAPVEIQTVVYTATTLAPGRHTVTIEATGNRNAAATGSLVVVDAADVRSRIEEADASVAMTAGWRSQGIGRAWSGSAPFTGNGMAVFSRNAGDQATISFTGTSVTWIAHRGPWNGIARVSVDGSFVADVDTYGATEQNQAAVFNTTGLADGSHTLTVEVTGSKNASATDSLVIVDAFDVALSSSAPSITRVQETGPATSYTGAWTSGGRFNLWSGDSAVFSGTAGAQATFTFTGTAVRWVGNRSFNGGIARVLLDGVEVATVDTWAPLQEEFQTPMYSVSGLPNSSHTLTIEATGQRAPFSFQNWVFVDAFEIH